MRSKNYEDASYPNSYRLRYTDPSAKTHGIAYGKIAEKIVSQIATLGPNFIWHLERGNEVSGWKVLETNECLTAQI